MCVCERERIGVRESECVRGVVFRISPEAQDVDGMMLVIFECGLVSDDRPLRLTNRGEWRK